MIIDKSIQGLFFVKRFLEKSMLIDDPITWLGTRILINFQQNYWELLFKSPLVSLKESLKTTNYMYFGFWRFIQMICLSYVPYYLV